MIPAGETGQAFAALDSLLILFDDKPTVRTLLEAIDDALDVGNRHQAPESSAFTVNPAACRAFFPPNRQKNPPGLDDSRDHLCRDALVRLVEQPAGDERAPPHDTRSIGLLSIRCIVPAIWLAHSASLAPSPRWSIGDTPSPTTRRCIRQAGQRLRGRARSTPSLDFSSAGS